MDYSEIKDHVKSECLDIASSYKWTVKFHETSDNELFNYLKGNFEKQDLSKLKVTFIHTHGSKVYNKDVIIDLVINNRSWVKFFLKPYIRDFNSFLEKARLERLKKPKKKSNGGKSITKCSAHKVFGCKHVLCTNNYF